MPASAQILVCCHSDMPTVSACYLSPLRERKAEKLQFADPSGRFYSLQARRFARDHRIVIKPIERQASHAMWLSFSSPCLFRRRRMSRSACHVCATECTKGLMQRTMCHYLIMRIGSIVWKQCLARQGVSGLSCLLGFEHEASFLAFCQQSAGSQCLPVISIFGPRLALTSLTASAVVPE